MKYVFLVIPVLLGSALFWNLYTPEKTTPTTTQTQREIPSGWKEYQNAPYDFSVLVPDDVTVHLIEEGQGAVTITFENAKEAQGFQIFIVPYSGDQVSAERFSQDIPSGVRKNARDITIDGATASSFDSTNFVVGETAEIWFIHGGFLYEVTTLKPLEHWLSGIMETWKFL